MSGGRFAACPCLGRIACGSCHRLVVPPVAGNLHRRHRELDAVFLEGVADHRQCVAPDDELFPGLGHHRQPNLDREFSELLNALHLQRLDDVRAEIGIVEQLLADLLDDLLCLHEIGVVGDVQADLVDRPVAVGS